MKHLAVIIAMLLVSSTVIAQDFQGIATYKSHRKMEIKLDSTQVNSEMQKRFMEAMKKQFEKTYILTFNKTESLYKEDVKLQAPQASGMRIEIMISTGESDDLYKNIKEDRYTGQNEMFGKVFLIEDKLQKLDWKLGSETKNIGEYTCYKATLIKERPKQKSFGENEEDEKEEKEGQEVEKEEYTVTAWYTPQIPVSNGPANYHGLPGLILEINDGSQTLICSKIVLNPKGKIKISEPTKGKKVNQEEFDKIMKKKTKEMQERYRHNRGDAHSMEIIIKG